MGPHPSCGERLAALAREELDIFKSYLAHARTGKDRAVHKARKALQRLRAIVMFLRPVNAVLGARENIAMRRLRRRLAPLRDAAARGETFRLLATRKQWKPFATQLRELASIEARHHSEAWVSHPPRDEFWDRIDSATVALEARVADWPFDRIDKHAVADVLENAERRLHKRIRVAAGEHGREIRHDMRRKLRRYANLLRAATPPDASDGDRVETLLSAAQRCGHEGDLWMALSSARRAARSIEDPESADKFAGLIRALERFRREKCRDHDKLLARVGRA